MTQTAFTGAGSPTNATLTSSTMYGAFGAASATSLSDTTETDFQMKFRQGTATLANLYAFIGIMTQTNNATLTVRQNTANSTMTTTITASTTGTYTDLTHTVSCADTDLIDYALTTGAGAGNIMLVGLGVQIQTSGQVGTTVAGIGAQAGSTSRFYNFGNSLTQQLEGADSAILLESATLSNLQSVISVNSSTGFTSVLRKNTTGSYANANQSNVVGSSATGLFEDTTHTDSLAATNLYNLNKPAASASATLSAISLKYLGGTSGRAVAQTVSSSGLTSGVTRFTGVFGVMMNSTEAQTQTVMPGVATFSVLSVNLNSNSSTSAMAVVFRNGAVTKNESVTVTASTTGIFQDLTNTDSVAANDKICYQASGSNNSTNTFTTFAALVTTSGAGPSGANQNLMSMGVG